MSIINPKHLGDSSLTGETVPLLFDYQATTPCNQAVLEAMKPYWTIEDIAYKDEGWPINLVDANGVHSTCEYIELTLDWRFALDFAQRKQYTLELGHPLV